MNLTVFGATGRDPGCLRTSGYACRRSLSPGYGRRMEPRRN
jgi:hypothetical protein